MVRDEFSETGHRERAEVNSPCSNCGTEGDVRVYGITVDGSRAANTDSSGATYLCSTCGRQARQNRRTLEGEDGGDRTQTPA